MHVFVDAFSHICTSIYLESRARRGGGASARNIGVFVRVQGSVGPELASDGWSNLHGARRRRALKTPMARRRQAKAPHHRAHTYACF